MTTKAKQTTPRKKSSPTPPQQPATKGYKNRAVQVVTSEGQSSKELAAAVAQKLSMPEVSAACVIESWQTDTHDVNALVDELQVQAQALNAGDLRRAESMLLSQAHALDNLFANLARRAANQEHLTQWEAYMRFAMKAQAQCRATLETLAAIKNPPVVFARQANINNGGQQQVNNQAPGAQPTRAPAGNRRIEQTELLEGNAHVDTAWSGHISPADRVASGGAGSN